MSDVMGTCNTSNEFTYKTQCLIIWTDEPGLYYIHNKTEPHRNGGTYTLDQIFNLFHDIQLFPHKGKFFELDVYWRWKNEREIEFINEHGNVTYVYYKHSDLTLN